MRKTFAVLILASVLVPSGALAAELRVGEEYVLRKDEVVKENLYATGGNVSIEGRVEGDLLAAGGAVMVSGTVTKDVIVGGGNVTVSGTVGDDLRVTGGTVTVSGTISGELVAAGGTVRVLSSTVINGNVLVAGGDVAIDGTVKGKVESYGGKVVIDGIVEGGVKSTASEKFIIGSHAKIKNGVSYKAPKEAVVEQGSTVSGDMVFTKTEPKRRGDAKRGLAALFGAWFVLKLIMMITAGLVLFFLAPHGLNEVSKKVFSGFWGSAARGFVILVVFPVAIILTCITVIGIPVAVVAGFGYLNFIIVSSVVAGILFGSFILKHLMRKEEYHISWKTVPIGIAALAIVAVIPLVGWIICALFFLAAFGSVVPTVYHKARELARRT